MPFRVEYYFHAKLVASIEGKERHDQVCSMLDRVHRAGQIREFSILNQETSFPTEEARQHLAETLRRFAVSHHVRLGRVFGSRKYGFSYPPWQFFLIFEDKELREVFPCRVGDHEVDPTGFLESLLSGTAWTLASGPPGRRTKHRELVEQLARNPEILGQRLKLLGTNVHVSRAFGELGYVDLVFEDQDAGYLLVEVKVKSEEIDKAIGQILRHRDLFTTQNFLSKSRVRVAIASPFVPDLARRICGEAGIQPVVIPSAPS